jgi:hypothetical protein
LEIVRICKRDIDELRELQLKHRRDWPATFSSNRKGDVWPYVTRGWTRHQQREDLKGVSQVLEKVARKLQYFRSERGRFFINDVGAFYKDETGARIQFVEFEWEPE